MKKVSYIISVIIIAIFIILPLNYIIEIPGPTFDVLGTQKDNADTIIKINDETISNAPLDIRLTTVSVLGGPDRYISIVSMLPKFLNKENIIMPTEAQYPLSKSVSEVSQSNTQAMGDSQDHAVFAALKTLGYDMTETNGSYNFPKGVEVSLTTQNIGGPSAGLEFSLGIYTSIKYHNSPLTENIKNLPIITGTGTMGFDLQVGAIGGINQKIMSSIESGAKYFFMPKTNCQDIFTDMDYSKIQLIPVSDLLEAERILDNLIMSKSQDFPTCKY